jgi:hypothetical protein
MTFLNPLVLLGLVAAAIPLIIHLFNFRRPRRVDFSSLAFLNELQKTTMQRVRIKQLLLLILRTLALACLILAFARPTLTGGLPGLGGTGASTVGILVDNSLSMTLRDAQGEYLEQAKDVAAGLISQLGTDDEVLVLGTADDPAAPPEPSGSRGAALAAVDALAPGYTSSTGSVAIARAAALVGESTRLNKELFYLTDLQQSTLTDSLAATLPEDVRVVVVPVGSRTYGNVAVTGVQVVSRIVEAGQPVKVEATLTNYGTEPVSSYVASAFLDGQRVAQAPADLPAQGSAVVSLTLTPQQRGWLSGTVQIEDDDFPFDNTHYFVLNVPERRRLLVVQGEGQTTQYVELALSPELTQGRLAFDAETIPETRLTSANLNAYDAVLLIGPRDLSSGEVAMLAAFVQQGGGLLLTPHAAVAADNYNAVLQALGGGRITGFSGSTTGGSPAIASFGRVDLEHPLFEGIFDAPGGQTRVESPNVYAGINYAPGGSNEQTLIQLSNGFPFLQEIRHGSGITFLLGVSPDLRWSDLPTRGLFLPLLYRSVFYLSSGETVAGDPLLAGRPAELRIPGVSGQAPARLISPEGEEFIPEQRTLFGAALLDLGTSLDTPGIYEVRSGDQLLRRVAVNLDSRESDLSAYTPEEAEQQLTARLGDNLLVSASPDIGAREIVEMLSEQRYGTEIWNVFLLLALLFLISEMLVARQWRPEGVAA